MTVSPGYLHRDREDGRVWLYVACAEHGQWHIWLVNASYGPGLRLRRECPLKRGGVIDIAIRGEPFDPVWRLLDGWLSPAYARAGAGHALG